MNCQYHMEDVKKIENPTGRAWLEINLDNLRHNFQEIRKIIPEKCKVMAVVKADAYGHGAIKTAIYLNRLGVEDFAVASLAEGRELREQGVKGQILILGYTPIEELELVSHYDLIQTIIDSDYGLKASKYVLKKGIILKVHIKLDTGMHRRGTSCWEEKQLNQLYSLKGLDIRGTYTHLCVADSAAPLDIEYTKGQIKGFYQAVDYLKKQGFTTGVLHIQSSYGVLNYPELSCDFVRIGIALYGALSRASDRTLLRKYPELKPVMSLKARVELVKTVEKGEFTGYGRNFTANRRTRIAIVSIGYCDGVPRSLSKEKGYVLIRGKRANIIGNICMDCLAVDVTEIFGVCAADIVTVIGEDQEEKILAEEVAENADTISNELLCRIGGRVRRL